jgi:NADPH2:quinone reductase
VRAVVLHETGGAARLVLEDLPKPEPGVGEKLLRVRAAGINFADLLVRLGRYPQPPALPAVLGNEVAGEVEGRRMIALPRGGGYAEWVEVDEAGLVPLPERASFAEGAAFLMAFLTAWIPLTRQVRVGAGSTVLVHAAAGGVGSAAVQLARHLGATVVATAGSKEKRSFAVSLGAEEAWSYDDFAEHVRADVVVDPIGGPVFAASLRAMNPLGTIIAIGYAAGLWEPVDPALLVGRNVGVTGFYLGRLMQLRPEIVREAIGELLGLWEAGAIRPVVGAEFPLEQAAEAHALVEGRGNVGKVVLVP